MPEEIFDVVNESDQVIKQMPRSEVHRLGLKHRAVHVLVFNRNGDLFLQKRSMLKDCFPGVWDSSASGHLDTNETYDDCAVRETEEELGWKLDRVPKRLFKISACSETGQEFVWVYECQADGPFKLHPTEIETGGWFRLDEVDRWVWERPDEFASGFVLIWKRYRGDPPAS